MYITGFLLIIIQSSCIGMDCSRKLQSSLKLLAILQLLGKYAESKF